MFSPLLFSGFVALHALQAARPAVAYPQAETTPVGSGNTKRDVCFANGVTYNSGDIVADGNDVQYQIYCDEDNSGTSFANYSVGSGGFNVCFQACDAQPGCKGFTFSGGDSGICYFKDRMGAFTSDENLVSAFIVQNASTSSSGSSTLMTTSTSSSVMPYPMSNTSTTAIPTAYETVSVSFVTMTSASVSSSTPSATPTVCSSTNGTFTDNDGNRWIVKCNTDNSQPDLDQASVPSFLDCFNSCAETQGCVSFTFLGGDGEGTCYFKGSAGTPSPAQGVDMAYMISPPAPKTSTSSLMVPYPTNSTSSSPPSSPTSFSLAFVTPTAASSSSPSSSSPAPTSTSSASAEPRLTVTVTATATVTDTVTDTVTVYASSTMSPSPTSSSVPVVTTTSTAPAVTVTDTTTVTTTVTTTQTVTATVVMSPVFTTVTATSTPTATAATR